jgi:NADPH:quinone reductase-like Zn-dependent oxidoreductase
MHRSAIGVLKSKFSSQRMVMFISKERHDDLPDLLDMIATGTLTPRIDDVVSLADAPRALDRMNQGEVSGKIAVRIG